MDAVKLAIAGAALLLVAAGAVVLGGRGTPPGARGAGSPASGKRPRREGEGAGSRASAADCVERIGGYPGR